ncbi:hypothetical protein GBF35_30190 [Nonomuraea phyllanthi]|uniref:hypothetical protein n=1 Tax=Nonomuraea phyllanthi TaxID=2219224 RepID=UPI00129332A9|nr:hypothetical protein [Nonomuraea phyllanthi]QFY10325.1 hypothetical protein GBF35_30190 [Nonomuraea phyllanthi]
MGLDYSYELYLHRRYAEGVLSDLAAGKTATHDSTGHTVVELPGGRHLVMPFTSGFTSGRTLPLSPELALDLTIGFTEDEHVRDYATARAIPAEDTDPRWSTNADGRLRYEIGYIYLTVHEASWLRPDHLELCFMAATSTMSRLFRDSASIRDFFATLAIRNSGLLCVLDVENDGKIVVSAGNQRLFEPLPGARWTSISDLLSTDGLIT